MKPNKQNHYTQSGICPETDEKQTIYIYTKSVGVLGTAVANELIINVSCPYLKANGCSRKVCPLVEATKDAHPEIV